VRYYCPNCWKDYWVEDFKTCPECGYSIKKHNDKSYVDKLLNALNHRAGEVRLFVIMILVQRKEKRAIPYLDKLSKETKDPSLVKAALEAVMRIHEGK
jgi:hypothetical protein